jgi:hypothetical protein
MTGDLSLHELWDSAPFGERAFRAVDISRLPEAAGRYLEHSIAPGTQLARAVRLRMHGEIKLKRWLPFTAEEVIVWDHGFIWSATVRMFRMPIRGSDRLVDGEGALRWRLFGVIPVMTASGPDITRSAADRVAGEAVWLPSVLCGDDVSWTAPDSSHLHARFTAHGYTAELELVVDEMGQLESVKLPRWGNPEDAEFRYVNFGAVVEEENTFDGYTIPTRLRIGWHFGTDRFESEGEFFRATIDDATYR